LHLVGESGTRYRSVFSGESVTVSEQQSLPLNEVFATFPVALLASEE
jgi:maltooligosyltrehalose synthase